MANIITFIRMTKSISWREGRGELKQALIPISCPSGVHQVSCCQSLLVCMNMYTFPYFVSSVSSCRNHMGMNFLPALSPRPAGYNIGQGSCPSNFLFVLDFRGDLLFSVGGEGWRWMGTGGGELMIFAGILQTIDIFEVHSNFANTVGDCSKNILFQGL